MRLRLLTASALVLGLASTVGVADAAAPKKPAPKKPTCKLVTDREGDGHATIGIASSNAIDITSADISTGPKLLTGVLRLKSSDYKDTWSMFGYTWILEFKIAGQQYRFKANANKNSTAPTYHFVIPSGSNSDAGITGKIAGNQITWTVPKTKLAASLKKSKTFTDIGASTGWYTNNADAAGVPGIKYTDLWPSCIGNK